MADNDTTHTIELHLVEAHARFRDGRPRPRHVVGNVGEQWQGVQRRAGAHAGQNRVPANGLLRALNRFRAGHPSAEPGRQPLIRTWKPLQQAYKGGHWLMLRELSRLRGNY